MSKKRGDHVFNNSLRQTLRDLAGLAEEVLGVEHRRPRGQGRADHIRRVLATLNDGLGLPAFDLTVSKPGAADEAGDANAVEYGKARQQLVWAFRQFLTALGEWAAVADKQTPGLYYRSLQQHGPELRLLIGRWTDAAIDHEAAAQAVREASSPRQVTDAIDAGRQYLEKLRVDLVDLVKYYSP